MSEDSRHAVNIEADKRMDDEKPTASLTMTSLNCFVDYLTRNGIQPSEVNVNFTPDWISGMSITLDLIGVDYDAVQRLGDEIGWLVDS